MTASVQRACRSSGLLAGVVLLALSGPAAAQPTELLRLHLEPGAAFYLSSPQTDRFAGGFWLGGRASIRLAGFLAGQVGLGYLVTSPAAGYRQTGSLTLVSGGVRFFPLGGSFERHPWLARVFVDSDASYASTGSLRRLALDAGLGIEMAVSRHAALGPFARYIQVVQWSTPPDLDPRDPKIIVFGLSASMSVVEASVCGNGILESGEDCDGQQFRYGCRDFRYESGTLACRSDCTIDSGGCHTCGNRIREAGEECDGEDFGGPTCERRGYSSGRLTCRPDCTVDDRQCYTCGDGVLTPATEACDTKGPVFPQGANTCKDLGFDGGELVCDHCERVDTARCTRPASPPCLVDPLWTGAVYFPQGSAEMIRSSMQTLRALAQGYKERADKERGDYVVALDGHASQEGTRQFNCDLSRRRAEAVQRVLTQEGVPAKTFRVCAYGNNVVESGFAGPLSRRVILRRMDRYTDQPWCPADPYQTGGGETCDKK